MKIEEIINKLENRSYTTKELTELGISRYNINKLIESSILTRASIGHYDCVVKKKQSKEALDHFNLFIKNVFARNYDKAYEELIGNFDTRTIYNHDYHLKIYFTLLNKLTSEEHDLSFLSELKIVKPEKEKDSLDLLFDRFLSNLSEEKYSAAYSYLKAFKEKEEQKLGYATISTKLFYNLMIGIRIKENSVKKEVEVKPQQVLVPYTNLIKQFDYYIDNDMYQEAYNIIDEIIARAYPKYKDNYIKIKNMLSTYFDLKNNHIILPELNINYESTDFGYIFNTALVKGDYKTALGNVGKLIYTNPNSKVLAQYRKLLFLISNTNKENIKKYNVVKPAVKVETIKTTVTSIDSQELYDLVYDAEHEKLYNLLDSYFKNPNNENNRTYYNLFQMLKVLKDLSLDKYRPREYTDMETNEFDSFRYFFEAMRKKNYQAAYNVVDACDDKNKARGNGNEFELYKYMLQDVLKEIKHFEEEKALTSEIKKHDDLIDTYIYHKGAYTKEEIVSFLKSLEDKKQFMIDNYMDLSDDEEKLVSLLRTIISFDNFYGEFSDYFDKKEYTGTLTERFNASMEYGDYPTSLEIITDSEWMSKTRNSENKKYFEAYKKLLFTLKNSTKAEPVKKEEDEVLEIPESENKIVLQQIKSYIKKNDYVSAFITYVDSSLDTTNPELKVYLDVILKYLVDYQTNESVILLQKSNEALRSGDTVKARTYLDAYKECIKDTGLDRELDYHYDRIDNLENRMNDDNFVLLENLYDAARYYLQQKDYKACIEKIDEFISLDKDRSARGYLLRGRAYEFLKDFNQAKSDYEKAIEISKEPNALFRLGRLAMYRGEYDNSLAYLTQMGERRTFINLKLMKYLTETYESLEDVENATKYQKRMGKFNKES